MTTKKTVYTKGAHEFTVVLQCTVQYEGASAFDEMHDRIARFRAKDPKL